VCECWYLCNLCRIAVKCAIKPHDFGFGLLRFVLRVGNAHTYTHTHTA